ncbi:MAG: hypothetical protein ACK4OF_06520 [Aquificaceae bacterium]
MRRVFLLVITLISFYSLSIAKEVPFTQEDRDRLIRLEVKVEEGQKALQKQIDGVQRQVDGLQKQIDELRSDFRTYMSVVLGALFTVIMGIIALIGFVLWDRRTTMSPVLKKTKELEEKDERIERVLKDLTKNNPELGEVLRRAGLL